MPLIPSSARFGYAVRRIFRFRGDSEDYGQQQMILCFHRTWSNYWTPWEWIRSTASKLLYEVFMPIRSISVLICFQWHSMYPTWQAGSMAQQQSSPLLVQRQLHGFVVCQCRSYGAHGSCCTCTRRRLAPVGQIAPTCTLWLAPGPIAPTCTRPDSAYLHPEAERGRNRDGGRQRRLHHCI